MNINKIKMSLTKIVASAALLVLSNSVMAASFFTLDGVVKETEIESWAWSMSRAVSDPATGRTSSMPYFDQVNISRVADSNSIRLLMSFLQGRPAYRGSIKTVDVDGFVESVLDFEQVIITGISTSGDTTSGPNAENITFTMSGFILTVFDRNGRATRAGYDIATATAK